MSVPSEPVLAVFHADPWLAGVAVIVSLVPVVVLALMFWVRDEHPGLFREPEIDLDPLWTARSPALSTDFDAQAIVHPRPPEDRVQQAA